MKWHTVTCTLHNWLTDNTYTYCRFSTHSATFSLLRYHIWHACGWLLKHGNKLYLSKGCKQRDKRGWKSKTWNPATECRGQDNSDCLSDQSVGCSVLTPPFRIGSVCLVPQKTVDDKTGLFRPDLLIPFTNVDNVNEKVTGAVARILEILFNQCGVNSPKTVVVITAAVQTLSLPLSSIQLSLSNKGLGEKKKS